MFKKSKIFSSFRDQVFVAWRSHLHQSDEHVNRLTWRGPAWKLNQFTERSNFLILSCLFWITICSLRTGKSNLGNAFTAINYFLPKYKVGLTKRILVNVHTTWICSANFSDKIIVESGDDGPSDRDHQVFVGALHEGVHPTAFVQTSGLLQDAHAFARLDAVSVVDWKNKIKKSFFLIFQEIAWQECD